MFNKFSDLKVFIQVGTMILIDILMILGVMKIFFGLDNSIIGGIIGFLGAIAGGIITFIGVRVTIKSRDEELFIERASKKLYLLEEVIAELKNSDFNKISLYPVDQGNASAFHSLVNGFYKTLEKNLKRLKENMDYNEMSILLHYFKILEGSINLSIVDFRKRIDHLNDCKDKVQSIMGVLLRNKDEIREKYYHIKNKRDIT